MRLPVSAFLLQPMAVQYVDWVVMHIGTAHKWPCLTDTVACVFVHSWLIYRRRRTG